MASADRLIEVFSEAKARPAGAERERFLAEACRDEPALQEQVLRLLQAHEGAGDFLKNSVPASATLLTEKPGDKIGRYKLLQQIGEGGCGVVYMAEQEEPVRRRVALKVIKLGMDTKSVIARFEAERQALALMDHPNIAKVFDGGATETGRPFFVMELVRGTRITEYCDQHDLSTQQRLELFIQVCQAIQHAHQKGIIHRDIKPSNILITVNDGVPVPKVIDFGIAKATEQRLTDKTVFTAFEQFIGTPAYMSPEQAEMTSLDIDTRADIYSLGVLLYELLTGNTPFDSQKLLASGVNEIRRIIREIEPPKPSTRLHTLSAAALSTVAARRRTEPPRLLHVVRGDLDWIVMKALEKDRRRRYETANGLAMDIQRHLNNETVTARAPTNLYRFQKLVRRNRLAFTAASAVVAALVLGLVVSTWMFFKEKHARQRAVAAEQEQSRMRRQAEAEAAEGRRLEVFLDTLAKRLRQERNLTNAEEVIRQELALERKLSGNGHPYVANSLVELAGILHDAGRTNEAEAAIREAMDVCEKMTGNEDLYLAHSLSLLGEGLTGLGKHAEAEEVFRKALAMRRKLFGNEHIDVARSLFLLGVNLSTQGKHAEAEAPLREALATRRNLLGNQHPNVANSLFHLGTVLWYEKKYPEAESVFREELALQRKLVGDEHLFVAAALSWLGATLSYENKLPEAEAAFRESLATRRKLFGHERAELASPLNGLATALCDSGKWSEAESLFRETLALKKKLPIDDPELANAVAGLTLALLHQQKFTEAESLARECLTNRETQFPGGWQVFSARSMLGCCLLEQNKYAEAEPLLLSGYEGLKQRADKIPVAGKRRAKTTLHRVVQFYEVAGQSEKAAEWKLKLSSID